MIIKSQFKLKEHENGLATNPAPGWDSLAKQGEKQSCTEIVGSVFSLGFAQKQEKRLIMVQKTL